MLPRRGLDLSAIAFPPKLPILAASGQYRALPRTGGTVTPDRIRDCRDGLWVVIQSPLVSGTSRSERPCD